MHFARILPLYSSMYLPCTHWRSEQLEDREEEPRGISQHEQVASPTSGQPIISLDSSKPTT